MDFEHNDKVKILHERLETFMDEHIYPNQKTYQQQLAEMGDNWAAVPITLINGIIHALVRLRNDT